MIKLLLLVILISTNAHAAQQTILSGPGAFFENEVVKINSNFDEKVDVSDVETLFVNGTLRLDPQTNELGVNPIWETCPTQSTIGSNETSNTTTAIDSDKTRGMSFDSGAGGVLYSITLDATGVTTAGTFEVRVDDDTDMSSEYLESATGTINEVGDVIIYFDGSTTLSASTTYYFFMMGIGTIDVTIAHNNTATDYTDGQLYYSNSGSLWTGLSTLSTQDLVFGVQLCD